MPWWVRPSSPANPARSMREDDRQALEADVVDDLVVGALQEGRVDRGRPGACPAVARPAAKVTACCSAMPTSKKRSGWTACELAERGAGRHRGGDRRRSAGRRWPARSASGRRRPGTWAAAAGVPAGRGAAVAETPWPRSRSVSAASKPLPFSVTTWRKTGPSTLRACRRASTIARMSWPSTGPM